MHKKQPTTRKFYPNLIRAVVVALQQIFQEKFYADKVIERTLKSNAKWGSRDRAFIAESVYDMVRWYRLLYEIYGQQPTTDQDWWSLFGILQVIRGIDLPDWQEFAALDPAAVREKHLALQPNRSIIQSIPDWLDELGERELDEKWEATLTVLNQPAAVVLRTNRLKTDPQQLQSALQQEDVITQVIEGDALQVMIRKNLFRTQPFQKGWFEIQDFSSQQVAPFLQVAPGMRVIDACAGAGGKALHLAALMRNKGQLIALDTESWKLNELRKRAKRAGVNLIDTRPITSTKVIKRLIGSADRLLLDVPCSGLGVLRRNPDAKWKLSPEYIQRIQTVQQDILASYSRMVKSGGYLVYATCSVLPSENRAQVDRFLAHADGDFTLEAEQVILPQDEGFDGFYMARLQKH